mmetsp:Transcript_14215/g.41388  ORF Transcript_14215/g.41388 Transcript_14215/m.41388 type:complete len:283 (+) Transcript_14215:550-1398(+)
MVRGFAAATAAAAVLMAAACASAELVVLQVRPPARARNVNAMAGSTSMLHHRTLPRSLPAPFPRRSLSFPGAESNPSFGSRRQTCYRRILCLGILCLGIGPAAGEDCMGPWCKRGSPKKKGCCAGRRPHSTRPSPPFMEPQHWPKCLPQGRCLLATGCSHGPPRSFLAGFWVGVDSRGGLQPRWQRWRQLLAAAPACGGGCPPPGSPQHRRPRGRPAAPRRRHVGISRRRPCEGSPACAPPSPSLCPLPGDADVACPWDTSPSTSSASPLFAGYWQKPRPGG